VFVFVLCFFVYAPISNHNRHCLSGKHSRGRAQGEARRKAQGVPGCGGTAVGLREFFCVFCFCFCSVFSLPPDNAQIVQADLLQKSLLPKVFKDDINAAFLATPVGKSRVAVAAAFLDACIEFGVVCGRRPSTTCDPRPTSVHTVGLPGHHEHGGGECIGARTAAPRNG
jgi:hypothetical protein